MALELEYIGRAPYQATKMSAGLDLYSNESVDLAAGPVTMVGTGTYLAIPEGHFGLLTIRSSLGADGIFLANNVGIIDADYRGEVKLAMRNMNSTPRHIAVGERIAQIIIIPFAQVSLKEVRAFDTTERGDGGFGSTGRQ